MQIHLPVTALQVQSGEQFGSCQHVQSVVNPEQWETVFLCDVVQFPLVHAEMQIPVLLLDENDRACLSLQ
jgi:hypothetical protein